MIPRWNNTNTNTKYVSSEEVFPAMFDDIQKNRSSFSFHGKKTTHSLNIAILSVLLAKDESDWIYLA